MSSGWIKVHRSMLDWEWWSDNCCCKLFFTCLLHANYVEKKFQGKSVPRGSFLTGWADLAQKTGMSVQQTRTAFSKLELTGELTRKSTNKGSLVTVTGYDKYQDLEIEQQADQQASQQASQQADQQASNKPVNKLVTTTKKYKNIEERKETKKNTPNPSRGGCPTVSELIENIPQDFPQSLKPIAMDWAEYKQSLPSSKKIKQIKSWLINLKRMRLYSPQILAEAVDCAIASGWQGWEQDNVKGHLHQNNPKTSPKPSHVAETSRKVDLAQQKYEESVKKLKEDQKNNPENYASDEEVDEFLREFGGKK